MTVPLLRVRRTSILNATRTFYRVNRINNINSNSEIFHKLLGARPLDREELRLSINIADRQCIKLLLRNILNIPPVAVQINSRRSRTRILRRRLIRMEAVDMVVLRRRLYL
jgi:hypothetical protein